MVGLSGNPDRTAYSVARLLQERGKRIVPIHPDAPTVLGEQGYATLADVPSVSTWSMCFVGRSRPGSSPTKPSRSAPRACGPAGVIDHEAFERTRAAGVPMVMDTCPAIEWARRRG